MVMIKEKISVCMASYNGEAYIATQIQSILDQLSPKDELIISDDNSADRTIEIILSFNDPRIKLVKGPCLGAYQNFGNAIIHATGDLIFLSDQDDIWHPNKVRLVKPLLSKYKLVLHNACIVDSQGKDMNDVLFSNRVVFSFWKNLIFHQTYGCCIAFCKEVVPLIIPIPNNKNILHETWISALVQLRYGNRSCYYLDQELISYRRHQTNVSEFRQSQRPVLPRIWERFILFYYIFKRFLIGD